MPCVRCAARETDPVRGPSAWKRGVQGGAQVLVCPDCQRDQDWRADLDRCAACASTMLVRALGETRCRTCGAVQDETEKTAGSVGREPGLAADVSAALTRVLRSHGPS